MRAVAAVAVLFTACGSFWDRPQDSFTATLLAPAAVAPRTTADSDKPRECPGNCLAAGAPVVSCSLADAVVGVRVAASGCKHPELSLIDYATPAADTLAKGVASGVDRSTFTAAVPLASATRNLLPSPETDPTGNLVRKPVAPILSAVTTCREQPHAAVEVPFVVKVDGFETRERLDLARVGSLQALVPISTGLVVVGDQGAKCVPEFEEGEAYGSTLRQSGDVADVISLDSFAVVLKRLDDATFRGDVAMWVSCSGYGVFGGASAALQYVDAVARLGPRLALVGRAADKSLAVVLTESRLQNPQVHALADSAGSLVRSIGRANDGSLIFVFASLGAPSRFQRVTVTENGAVSVDELAPIGDADVPADGVQVWTAPDASFFVYGWNTGGVGPWTDVAASLLRARSLDAVANRWSRALEVNQLVFRADQLLVPSSGGVMSLDTATGAQRWAYRTTQPLIPHGPDVSRVQVLPGALVYSQRQREAQVFQAAEQPLWHGETATLGLDGSVRFVLRALPNGVEQTSRLVADLDGHLYGTGRTSFVRLSLRTPMLEAPETRCARLDCGAGEVDLANDAANCGRCGNACGGSQRCVGGSCL